MKMLWLQIALLRSTWIVCTFVLLVGASAVSIASETTNEGPLIQSDGVADMDITELVQLRVSPFDVSALFDRGYHASNAVTASRCDAPIRDLPFAIQAYTESFIQDQKPVNIYDIVRYSPGVTYRSNDFNEGNANLAIRGFTVSNTPGNVQILRNSFHGPSIFDFSNIARVEVVKGPSSFLYGQVAPGGVVNVITKSPQPEFAATATTQYGSYGQYKLQSDVTGPATSKLFYRLITSYDHDLEYWDPYDAHSWDVSPSLVWQPNGRVSVSINYERFQKDENPQVMQKPGYGSQTGVVPTLSDPNLSGVDVPGLGKKWNSMSYADFRYSTSDNLSAWIDLKAEEHWDVRVGYSHLEYEVDALFSGNMGMSNTSTFLQGRRLRRQFYSNEDDSVQVDAVGLYNVAQTSFRMLVGAQYVDRRFDRWAGQAPDDPSLGNDPIVSPLPLWDLTDPSTWDRKVDIPLSVLTENRFDETTDYSEESLYGGLNIGFFEDRLLILTGWRWTDAKSCFTDNIDELSKQEIVADKVTPQYGMLYKLMSELSLYASYTESFVGGTQFLLNLDNSLSAAKPTKGKGYEIGLKTDLFEGRFSGTLTYFDIINKNVVNDLAVTDSLGDVYIYNVQSGKQRSNGIELDTTTTLSENWQLYLSYSYMDARITEFSGHDMEILAQDWTTLDEAGQSNYRNVLRFHDAPLQMSAPHMANLWTRYTFRQGWLDGFYVAGGVNYVYDQTLLSDSPESANQTYALVNGMIGYAWEMDGVRFRLELNGKNMTDKYYRPSQSKRCRPREFLLTLIARF